VGITTTTTTTTTAVKPLWLSRDVLLALSLLLLAIFWAPAGLVALRRGPSRVWRHPSGPFSRLRGAYAARLRPAGRARRRVLA
jgi:hypothetical protein